MERRGDRQTYCQVAVSYKIKLRELPAVQCLGLLLSLLRAWVQFLVWELRAHKPPDEAKEKRKTKLRRARSQGAGWGTITSRVAWEGNLAVENHDGILVPGEKFRQNGAGV